MKPKNELIEAIRRHERDAQLLLYLKCVLAIVGIVVIILLLRAALLAPAPIDLPDPDVEKKEVFNRLDARGLSRSTTVEITETGYRFEWTDGKFLPH